MHYCAIIIKPVKVGIVEARKLFGDVLVSHEKADFYSTDDYRERVFKDGKKVMPLSEFKPIYESEWVGDENEYNQKTWDFATIDSYGEEETEIYLDNQILPSDFYEYWEQEEKRKEIIKLQDELFKLETIRIITELLKSETQYDVVLLDYHN